MLSQIRAFEAERQEWDEQRDALVKERVAAEKKARCRRSAHRFEQNLSTMLQFPHYSFHLELLSQPQKDINVPEVLLGSALP
eukprot:1471093-Amphidinium_carterae.1